MDREACKARIREDMESSMMRLIEIEQEKMRARGWAISLMQFLDALEAEYPKAEARWRASNEGLELGEEYIALRREVYMEVVRTLKLRATN